MVKNTFVCVCVLVVSSYSTNTSPWDEWPMRSFVCCPNDSGPRKECLWGRFGQEFLRTKHKNTQWELENIWKTPKQQLVWILSWLAASFHSSPRWDGKRKAARPRGRLREQVASSNATVERTMDHGAWMSVYQGTELWQRKRSSRQLRAIRRNTPDLAICIPWRDLRLPRSKQTRHQDKQNHAKKHRVTRNCTQALIFTKTYCRSSWHLD